MALNLILIAWVLVLFVACLNCGAEPVKLKGGCGIFIQGDTEKLLIESGPYTKEEGYIGIKEDWDRHIVKIHPQSPAEGAGLQWNDKILSVDGVKGAPIVGRAFTSCVVRVRRITEIYRVGSQWKSKSEELDFTITRLPKRYIKPYNFNPDTARWSSGSSVGS